MPMYFAEFRNMIVTANRNGSIPINAKIVATFTPEDDGHAREALISQANRHAELQEREK